MYRIIIVFLFLAGTQFSTQCQSEDWFTNIDEAKISAQTNSKAILMVFAGSDWCKPCIQFKKDILEDTAFIEFAKENFVILYLDFPARKKNRLSKEQTTHNEALAEKYNRQGSFPKVVLIDSDENILSQPDFHGQSTSIFISELKERN